MAPNDGASWATASTNLQDALSVATSGDEIWVAQGTYYPDEGGTSTPDDPDSVFNLIDGVALYGGFPTGGGDGTFAVRDYVAYPTILSGDLLQNDGPDFTNNEDNARHVLTANASVGTNAILDGFTVTAGYGLMVFLYGTGAGLICQSAAPTLVNCSFEGNRTGRGGAIANYDSSPTLVNCRFLDNFGQESGGAIRNERSFPSLTDCSFEGNSAFRGGAIYAVGNLPGPTAVHSFSNCTFRNNSAYYSGGAIYHENTSPFFTNCLFVGNSATNFGGAMCNWIRSSPSLSHCTFIGNSATERRRHASNQETGQSSYGGAIYNAGQSSPAIAHCSFISNSTGQEGGALYNKDSSSPSVSHCSFEGNSAASGGAVGSYSSYATSYATFTNCSFKGNSAAFFDVSGETIGWGGAVWNGSSPSTFVGCVFQGNSAFKGGGVGRGIYYNCTLTGNSAVESGGGAFGGTFYNCLVYFNSSPTGENYHSDTYKTISLDHSCSTPLPTNGVGNITNAPLFVNTNRWSDLRLRYNSPGIDAGNNDFVASSTDLDGNPRILGGTVDMGAYEFVPQDLAGWPSATVLTADRVRVQATVEPNGVDTKAWFEWGLTANYGNQTVTAELDATYPSAIVRTEISGLAPATTYHYRLVTSNTLGMVSMSQDFLFRTPEVALVQTLPATELTPFSAKLNGTAHANAADCYVWFEWGTTLDYSQRTVPVRLASMGTTVTVRTPVTGLSPDTEYHCRLMVSNRVGVAVGPDQTFTTLHVPANLYVWLDSPNPAPPYATWDAAAHSIQKAVDAARNGDTVFVTNGIYATGETGNNRVAIAKAITVRSVNGPALTVIDGLGSIRCVSLGANARLSGFTLTNGYASSGGGGGALCDASAILTNCLIIANSAYDGGGGTRNGTYYNCTITDNSTEGSGGGVLLATLFNCAVTGNSAAKSGGGVYKGELFNCVVAGNSAALWGGGVNGATLSHCTLTGNYGTYGGGAYGCTLNYCIAYFNAAPDGANYGGDDTLPITYNYSCATPLPSRGVGNITNAPLFVNTNGWSDLRLRYGSPGIDAGTDLSAHLTTDLDGNPRPLDGDGDGVAAFDMGAYEFNAQALIPPDWLTGHGLDAADPQVVWANPDLDPFNTFEEWLADTDPTNADSRFQIVSITKHSPAMISFPSSIHRTYTLLRTTTLQPPNWTVVPGQEAIPGNGGVLTLSDVEEGAAQYYRIEVNLP